MGFFYSYALKYYKALKAKALFSPLRRRQTDYTYSIISMQVKLESFLSSGYGQGFSSGHTWALPHYLSWTLLHKLMMYPTQFGAWKMHQVSSQSQIVSPSWTKLIQEGMKMTRMRKRTTMMMMRQCHYQNLNTFQNPTTCAPKLDRYLLQLLDLDWDNLSRHSIAITKVKLVI